MFRKLLSRDPMPTNLLGAVAPGVEYAKETEEEQKKAISAYRETAGPSTGTSNSYILVYVHIHVLT